MAAVLAATVRLNGIEAALQGLRRFSTLMGENEARLGKTRSTADLTTASLLKIWAAYQYVTSASSIANAVTTLWSNALGYLMNTILLPILPLLIDIGLAIFRFGAWMSEQGPVIKAMALGIGIAFGLMWLGVGGPISLIIGALVAVAAVIYSYRDELMPIVEAFGAVFGFVWGNIWKVLVVATTPLRAFWGLIDGFITALTGQGGLGLLVSVWEAGWGVMTRVIEKAWEIIRPIVDGVKGFFDGVADISGSVVQGASDVGSFLGGGLNTLIGAASSDVVAAGANGLGAPVPVLGGVGGGGTSSTVSNETWNVSVNAGGASGMDMGIAFRNEASLSRRRA